LFFGFVDDSIVFVLRLVFEFRMQFSHRDRRADELVDQLPEVYRFRVAGNVDDLLRNLLRLVCVLEQNPPFEVHRKIEWLQRTVADQFYRTLDVDSGIQEGFLFVQCYNGLKVTLLDHFLSEMLKERVPDSVAEFVSLIA